jgi:hypothetical protein
LYSILQNIRFSIISPLSTGEHFYSILSALQPSPQVRKKTYYKKYFFFIICKKISLRELIIKISGELIQIIINKAYLSALNEFLHCGELKRISGELIIFSGELKRISGELIIFSGELKRIAYKKKNKP